MATVRVITTPRLAMRRLRLADAPFILELLNDPGWLEFIGDRGVRDLAGARDYIRQGPKAMYRRLGYGLYLVERRTDGVAVGLSGLTWRKALGKIEIGLAFLERFQRQGYGLESAKAVMRHARDDLGLDRVWAITLPGNTGSRRILEVLGMSCEGQVRLAPEEPELMLWSGPPGPPGAAGSGAGP